MLHTINKSPFASDALAACLKYARPGSAILLLEDGVYAATRDTAASSQLLEAMKTLPVYALKPDVDARGMQGRVIDGVQLVGYDGFVDLAAEHSAVQAWV